MEYPKILVGLIGVSVVLLVVSFLGKRAEWFLNLVLRTVFGTILICFINWGLGMLGLAVTVGINAATVLTAGILGFPGILALYGLVVYRML